MDDNRKRQKTERAIVRMLLHGLKSAGWNATYVDTGDDISPYVAVRTETETMDQVFSVDTSTITFENAAGNRHGVLIVLGNGIDTIADYSHAQDDLDGFGVAVDAVYDAVSARFED